MSRVRFAEIDALATGNAKHWKVQTRDAGTLLGRVSWCALWRRYVFVAEPKTLLEEECLREIAAFVERASRGHRFRILGRNEEPAPEVSGG